MSRVKNRLSIRLPKSHVPVVACRWAGIRTRGRLTARKKPAAGGEPANPAKRGTRLKATTDRAFSSLPEFQDWRTEEACLSCRACGGDFIPSKRRPLNAAGESPVARRVHGAAPDRHRASSFRRTLAITVGGVTEPSASPSRARSVASPSTKSLPVRSLERSSRGCRDDRSHH